MAEKNSLWKNIRKKAEQNRRTGAKPKEPTAEMLRQERKIKAKQYPDGGPVNTLEGDLISKVIMNRNRDKDFVQRAYAVGEYPESNMFVQPDVNEFGQKNSHLMGWGEDESGQAYMYPEVMNPNNEAIKVPNQYADYISSTGYKKATGIPYAHGGPTKSLVQPPVLLDDNIIYPTDNPYIPGVNKDILDSEYDSYMRWREGFINNQGMTPEEYYQTYPSRQEYDRQNFDPANLYNSVSLAQGGYMYPDGGPVTLYKKAQYDANTGRILEYAGSQGNKYYVTPDTPEGIDFESRLPEFEVIEDTGKYNPNTFGYTAPEYIPSETGLVPNPKYIPLASGALEPVYPEEALLPASLPFKATTRLGKAALFGAELANPLGGFRNVSVKNVGAFENIPKPTKEVLEDMKGFLKRREFIKNLQKEKLIGKEFKDLNYAARSTDKTNALTKLALDRDATRFRGVQGSVPKDGIIEQELSGFPLDMSKPAYGQYISEFDNMKAAGVDFKDPISIAKYQASHIPMQQYGYRSGMPEMAYVDALYTTKEPPLSSPFGYGNYLIKMSSPRNYSIGNYQDWFNKYHNVKDRNFHKLAVNDGYYNSRWAPDTPYELPVLLDNSSVVGIKGTKMFDVDDTFPFMDYKRLNSEQQRQYDDFIKKYKEDYDTGWKGQYKKGGHINPYMYYAGGPMQYKRGGTLEDVGKLLVNTVASPIEQISGNNFVNWNYNNKWAADAAAVSEGIIGAATDVAGSVLLPGVYGQAKGAIQGFTKNIGNSTEEQRNANKWANTTGQIASSAGDLTAGIMSGDVKQIVGGSGKLLGTIGGETGSKELSMLGQVAGIGSMFINPSQTTSSSIPTGLPIDSSIPSFNPTTDIVNQGLSFAANGGSLNNEKYLVNSQIDSMRNRYKKYKSGGSTNKFGVNFISDDAGIHDENSYGGVPIGPQSLAEGGEAVIYDNQGNPSYVMPDQVNGVKNMKDFTITSNGKIKYSKETLAKAMERKLNKLRGDSISEHTANQIKNEYISKRETLAQINAIEDAKKTVMEEYVAAYGGKLPNKYKGKINMPSMKAKGGPVVSNVNQDFDLYAQNRGGMMMAQGGNMYAAGGPGKRIIGIDEYGDPIYQNVTTTSTQPIQPDVNYGDDYFLNRQPSIPMENYDPNVTKPSTPVMGKINSQPGISYTQPEKTIDDFYQEPILPQASQKVSEPIDFTSPLGTFEGVDASGNPVSINPALKETYNQGWRPEGASIPKVNQPNWYNEPWYNVAAGIGQIIPSLNAMREFDKMSKRKLTPEKKSPSKVNLERFRITAKEEGRRLLNSALRTIRGGSSNTGQLAGNTRDTILNYIKNMGANIAKSYETEENTNAQLAQQAALANQQYSNAFKQLNEEIFQAGREGFIDASQQAASIGSQNVKSLNRLRNQRMQIANMDTDDYIMVTDPDTGLPVKAFKSSDNTYKILT